jgi:cysteine-rich repeat protein
VSGDALLRVPVNQGETLYVVVESPDREESSAFQLIAAAREIVCGDGHVDADEGCDDGNFVTDDGCSSECVFQPDEVEPNATVQTANVYAPSAFFASIADAADVDVVAIEVAAGQKLIAQTFDLGDGGCARFELDNLIEVLNSVGTPFGSDDDGGTGFCAALATDALSAGTYHVRVSASGVAESFLYRLSLTLED